MKVRCHEGIGLGSKTSRLISSDPLPPMRLHLMKVPEPLQTALTVGDQVFRHMGLRVHFTLEPWQHCFYADHLLGCTLGNSWILVHEGLIHLVPEFVVLMMI